MQRPVWFNKQYKYCCQTNKGNSKPDRKKISNKQTAGKNYLENKKAERSEM